VPQWSTGSSALAIGNLQAGIYTVTVTNIDNCTATATVSVGNNGEPFSLDLTTQSTTCEQANGFIFVTTSPTSMLHFSWSDGSSNTSLQNIASGTYSVTLTNTEGCAASKSAYVDNIDLIPNPNLTVQPDKCSRNTGSISLAPMPNTSYSWSNGATTPTIDHLAEAVYTVTITSGLCNTVSSIAIVATPTPILTITASTSPCNPADIALIAHLNSTSFGFHWNNGSSADTLKHAFAGIYTVTATDFFSCTATASYQVIAAPYQPFSIRASADTIYLGQAVTLSVHSNMLQPRYYWYPVSGSQSSISFKPTASQLYRVGASNIYGCAEDADKYIVVLPVDFNIPTVFTPNGDGENDFFYVVSNAPIQVINLQIYNRWGTLVYSEANNTVQNHRTDGWDGNFNSEPQPTDAYIYTLTVKTFDGKEHERKGDIVLIR
jgi:gliding motility-associated-like protein